ncbi:MAG: diaminopimelate epimerase [Desulfobacterales bacterium]|nr:MAG: diaminopimelate epimerase [Desulfobacterales bacterium]
MGKIDFYKMSGSGNDFIIVDNRRKLFDEADLPDFVTRVCRRKMSVGADGFILIEPSTAADFKWRFFNRDGSSGEMCGNGARCTARFAYLNQIAGASMSFETEAGIVQAHVKGERVVVKMPEPRDLQLDYTLRLQNGPWLVNRINTGVPHVVILTDRLDDVDVVQLGREIRMHEAFAPAGTNVNFISLQNNGEVAIRTYERGVEDETLACGTGSAASALIAARKYKAKSPVRVKTRSAEYLTIHFEERQGRFYDVHLEGDARIIYAGRLWDDAWKD